MGGLGGVDQHQFPFAPHLRPDGSHRTAEVPLGDVANGDDQREPDVREQEGGFLLHTRQGLGRWCVGDHPCRVRVEEVTPLDVAGPPHQQALQPADRAIEHGPHPLVPGEHPIAPRPERRHEPPPERALDLLERALLPRQRSPEPIDLALQEAPLPTYVPEDRQERFGGGRTDSSLGQAHARSRVSAGVRGAAPSEPPADASEPACAISTSAAPARPTNANTSG